MEFLEDELDRQSLVKRRLTCSHFNRRGRGGIPTSDEPGDALKRYKSNFSDDEEDDDGGAQQPQADRVDTDYQSFSKRKSTQSGRNPVEMSPSEGKVMDDLARQFGKELINKSEDISHVEISK